MFEMVNCGIVKVFYTDEGTFADVEGLQKMYDAYYPDGKGKEITDIIDEREVETRLLADAEGEEIECVEIFDAMAAMQYLKKAKEYKSRGWSILLRTVYQNFEYAAWNEAVKKVTQEILRKLNNQDEKEKTLMAVGRLLTDRRDKMARQIEAAAANLYKED